MPNNDQLQRPPLLHEPPPEQRQDVLFDPLKQDIGAGDVSALAHSLHRPPSAGGGDLSVDGDGVNAAYKHGDGSLDATVAYDGTISGSGGYGEHGLSLERAADGSVSTGVKLGAVNVSQGGGVIGAGVKLPLSSPASSVLQAVPDARPASKGPPSSITLGGSYEAESRTTSLGLGYKVGDTKAGVDISLGREGASFGASVGNKAASLSFGFSSTQTHESGFQDGAYQSAVSNEKSMMVGGTLYGLGGTLSTGHSSSTSLQGDGIHDIDKRASEYAAGRPVRAEEIQPGEVLVSEQEHTVGGSGGFALGLVATGSLEHSASDQRSIARDRSGFTLQSTHYDAEVSGSTFGTVLENTERTRTDASAQQVRYRVDADHPQAAQIVADFADFGLLPGAERAASGEPDGAALVAELAEARVVLAGYDQQLADAPEVVRPMLWVTRQQLLSECRPLVEKINRYALDAAARGEDLSPAASLVSHAQLDGTERTVQRHSLLGSGKVSSTGGQSVVREVALDEDGAATYSATETHEDHDSRHVVHTSSDDDERALVVSAGDRDGAYSGEIALSSDLIDRIGDGLSAGAAGEALWASLYQDALRGAETGAWMSVDLSAFRTREAFAAASPVAQETFVRCVLLARAEKKPRLEDAAFVAQHLNPLELTVAISQVADPLVRARLLELMGQEMVGDARQQLSVIRGRLADRPELADELADAEQARGALEGEGFSMATATSEQQAARLDAQLIRADPQELYDFLLQVRRLYGPEGVRDLFAAAQSTPRAVWLCLASTSSRRPRDFVENILAGTPQQAALKDWAEGDDHAWEVRMTDRLRFDAQAEALSPRQHEVSESDKLQEQLRLRAQADAEQQKITQMLADERQRRAARVSLPAELAGAMVEVSDLVVQRAGADAVLAALLRIERAHGAAGLRAIATHLSAPAFQEALKTDFTGELRSLLQDAGAL